MIIALDTNAYVAFIRGEEAIYNNIKKADEIVMPFVVLGELYYGFYNGNKSAKNIQILEEFIKDLDVTIVHSVDQTALIFGEISAELAAIGKPMQQNDVWIAAICKQYNYSLLTLDKGFSNILGLRLLPL